MGRRKIEIKAIKDDRNRSVTFVKRKGGLFKKAHELSVLCSVDVAVIIFGNNKKLYEFSSSDIGEILTRYPFYGGANEHKGPGDFTGKGMDDDDDDDDVGSGMSQHGGEPIQQQMLPPQFQNQAPFQHIRNNTPGASPSILQNARYEDDVEISDVSTPSMISQGADDNDIDFNPPKAEPAFFCPESSANCVDPNSINATLQPGNTLPSNGQADNVGRLWPGIPQQQAAVAKVQAQQKQIIQQQRKVVASSPGQSQRIRAPHLATNRLAEEKISRLLNSMRQSSVTTEGDDSQGAMNGMTLAQRAKKEEDEMAEDERLLASEEGKRLSSKERRQLRNKVSARAYRSRRKEYIGQLEGEIAARVNEVTDLRTQNRALMVENRRLTDLTRVL